MLSDRDIEKLLDREIVIYPYRPDKDLTPLGYNLNPSNFVFSLKNGSLIQADDNKDDTKVFKIAAHDTVLILTQEAVWVSKKIAGTFHSKVGVVSSGFGHISTTLDPGWAGPLLFSLNNPTDRELELPAEKSFVTLIFYKLRKPAYRDHDNSPSRADLLEEISTAISLNINKNKPGLFPNKKADQLAEKQEKFLKKARSIINEPYAYNEFKQKYDELSNNSKGYILRGVKRNTEENIFKFIQFWILILFEFIVVCIILLKITSKFIHQITFIDNLVDKASFLAITAILFTALQLTFSMKQD